MNDTDIRLGVYICHCGSNIASVIDCPTLAEWAQAELGARGVIVARDYKFTCSGPGQAIIEKDIKELGVNRVIVAACSPHLHEQTFRAACARAGLNPYLFEMVSLREQIAWVTPDKQAALDKAKHLISGAVERIRYDVPLQPLRVPIHPATLVVGGGIAGIQAALELAESGFPVYLVEREPSIGGHMAQLDKTFPTLDCSACILTPKMVQVENHPNITLMTWSEVTHVDGYVGNFKVTVKMRARSVNTALCTGCGLCQEKCPKQVIDDVFEAGLGYRKAIYTPFAQAVPKYPVIDRANCIYFEKGACKACEKFCASKAIDFDQQDEYRTFPVGNIVLTTGYDLFDARRIPQYGYGTYPGVFTSMEFERLINAAGPTGGRVVLRDGVTVPKTVGIIHCVGSRDKNYNNYCSAICCMQSLKFAHIVRERTGARVWNFYIDMRTVSKDYDEFYQRVLHEGVRFVRGRAAEVTTVARESEEEGKLIIQAEDGLMGKQIRVPVDMIILSAGMQPRANAKAMGQLFGISCNQDGWFIEKHPKLDPVATMTQGLLVAGCAQGPKDIPGSVAQGAAAAARVIGMIQQKEITLEPIRATVNAECCSGCRMCNTLCPFHAIAFLADRGVSEINAALCQGCGTCIAACPAGAITGTGFGDQQILAQLAGLLTLHGFGAGATAAVPA